MHRKISILMLATVLLLMGAAPVRAQFWDCSTGLLQAPSADMNSDGTFMITNNFINKNAISKWYWGYHTFMYGIHVDLWSRLEIGYVCVILNGAWDPRPEEEKSYRLKILRNQDRHFVGKLLLLREGDFGIPWLPALAVGFSDPTTGTGADYSDAAVGGSGNGFFNRYYVVATKHFATPAGQIGAHLGYQYNRRTDFPMNGPSVAIDWTPVWIQNKGILDNVKVILEYDSRTVNMGFIASIWENRFEAMFELQNFQWVNFGLRYKLRLKKAN